MAGKGAENIGRPEMVLKKLAHKVYYKRFFALYIRKQESNYA